MMNQIDHEILGESRLATQFRESTNLIAYILNLLLEANTLEQLFFDINTGRYLDSAVGTQLDILGSIVGQPREIISGIILIDSEYRLWIKARIGKNHTGASRENILDQITFLIPDANQILIEEGNTRYSVSIGKLLTVEERDTIFNSGILSKPAGVSVGYVSQYDYNNFFSIGTVPNGLGFGTISDPLIGGVFATLI